MKCIWIWQICKNMHPIFADDVLVTGARLSLVVKIHEYVSGSNPVIEFSNPVIELMHLGVLLFKFWTWPGRQPGSPSPSGWKAQQATHCDCKHWAWSGQEHTGLRTRFQVIQISGATLVRVLKDWLQQQAEEPGAGTLFKKLLVLVVSILKTNQAKIIKWSPTG